MVTSLCSIIRTFTLFPKGSCCWLFASFFACCIIFCLLHCTARASSALESARAAPTSEPSTVSRYVEESVSFLVVLFLWMEGLGNRLSFVDRTWLLMIDRPSACVRRDALGSVSAAPLRPLEPRRKTATCRAAGFHRKLVEGDLRSVCTNIPLGLPTLDAMRMTSQTASWAARPQAIA